MELLRTAALVAATLTMGLITGAFYLYAVAIMPGLARTGDRTFVGAFQAIDRAIINPLFMLSFVGALIFTGLAALLHLTEDALPLLLVAFALYLVVFVATIRVNVPLNDGIKAAGDPDEIEDLAGVRQRFNEAKWVRWNTFRTVLSLLAFGLLAIVLLTS
jgi:uncharacterized membrane protein